MSEVARRLSAPMGPFRRPRRETRALVAGSRASSRAGPEDRGDRSAGASTPWYSLRRSGRAHDPYRFCLEGAARRHVGRDRLLSAEAAQ